MSYYCMKCKKDVNTRKDILKPVIECVLRCVDCGHRNFEAESSLAREVTDTTKRERATLLAMEKLSEKLKTTEGPQRAELIRKMGNEKLNLIGEYEHAEYRD